MDKKTLRPLVFDVLRKTPQTHLHAIENELRQRFEEYERSDVLALHEVVWELLIQGVLAPGKNSLNLNLPFVHVTDYGARCLDDGSILAHDPDGYIERLSSQIPSSAGDANAQVIDAAREGLLCFLAGRYAASVVCFGRAADVLFELLVAATLRAARRAHRSTRSLEESGRNPKARLRAVLRSSILRNLPPEWTEDLEPHVTGLLMLIQRSQSDTGSPRHPHVDRDQTLAYILLFPIQCRFVYHLISHIEGKTIDE